METIKELINKLNVTFFKVKEGEFVIVFGNENNTSYLCTKDITMFIGSNSRF